MLECQMSLLRAGKRLSRSGADGSANGLWADSSISGPNGGGGELSQDSLAV